MARPSSAVKRQTSIITHRIAGVEVLRTDGCASVLPGSSRITPVAFAIASTPESASTIPTKPAQFCQKPPCSGWHRNQKGETAGVFRSEQIEQPDDQDGGGGEFFRMRHAEIGEGGKRADGRGYQIIGDKEKGANDGDDFAAMTH